MKIDFDELGKFSNRETYETYIDGLVRKSNDEDPIYLSDCLITKEQDGQAVLVKLAEYTNELKTMGQELTWKIFVIRDEWGNPSNPGDKVVRTYKRPLTHTVNGQSSPIPGKVLSNYKALGIYEQKMEYTKEFTVDKKGCITCGFDDAVHFLNLWGIHGVTNARLTSKDSHSTEPVLCPDGQKRHVWYHRFKEMSPEMYKNLPKLEVSEKPKRGYPKEETSQESE